MAGVVVTRGQTQLMNLPSSQGFETVMEAMAHWRQISPKFALIVGAF